MKIKDQIRSRREALGMTMKELADRVGTSEQAVRQWETRGSIPRQKTLRLVEQALSFQIDFTEGLAPPGGGKTAAAYIEQSDIDLVLIIGRLPLHAKTVIGEMARMHLEAVEAARAAESKNPPAPPPPTIQASTSRRTSAKKTTAR
ncbi:helix-turn-helix transcriptional regulator [Piscinibacter gummiphilus]|uniref:Helix-turn-helix transcriptional regulator n=1 Tax=Piscinibacter gummiphilus TaxID=946333 RepID=A0ABZ0CNG8_9BURK|nr:helix-turn-helix transcriptional regulator [Piscinibacter gummiphilus]WOB06535.1 helix-turn-helix transcriptional regulator [Piscinibacter gummiphilus]